MPRTAVLVLFVTPTLFAAPVPPDAAESRLRRVYGTPVDPAGDTLFTLHCEQLCVTVAGGFHSLHEAPDPRGPLPPGTGLPPRPPNPNPGGRNAPKVWRDVTDDFTLVIRVVFPTGPGYRAAGLIAWAGEDDYVALRATTEHVGEFEVWAARPGGNHSWSYRLNKVEEPTAYLRLQRVGPRLFPARSWDGEEWDECEPVVVGWGPTMKVGVVAENTAPAPFTAVFDRYELTAGKK